MKATRVNVERIATQRGLEPIQIDGIPEGFSFKAPDLEVGGKLYAGQYVVYVPNTEKIVWGYHLDTLLEQYNLEIEYGAKQRH